MLIRFFVIANRAALNRLFCNREINSNDAGFVGRRGFDRKLERVQCRARVAARDIYEMRERVIADFNFLFAIAMRLVRDRAAEEWRKRRGASERGSKGENEK